jgi:lysophospholipase L1-like esterase
MRPRSIDWRWRASLLAAACLLAIAACKTERRTAPTAVVTISPTLAAEPVNHLPGVIVVLGSSTAAGTGPSRRENAWVWLYTAYLKRHFPKFALTNLAVGGFTTYQMQPSDYVPPTNRPAPDPEHNVTRALSLHPDAIIINMPSNDQAGGYSLAEQLANYDRVTELAIQGGALVWVTTSQPRDFADPVDRAGLLATRHALKDKYGDHALDFRTAFADPEGKIKAAYNAGDGVHLNDAAHALLAQQVIEAKIPHATQAADRRK